jgi:hypothetical protein
VIAPDFLSRPSFSISSAMLVADYLSQFFTCLLCLLDASLRHARRLSDHLRKYCNAGEHNQGYHPDRLAPAGDVVTPKQIAYNDDEQPEPEDEHEYGERIR